MDKKNSVLIALVTSERHKVYIDDYLEQVNSFIERDSPFDIDLCIVETTPNTTKYYKELKDKTDFKVLRYDWDTSKEIVFEMMCKAKNILRDVFLKGDYTHYFSLDTDTFIPPYSLESLVADDKDNVGFPTPIWGNEPCLFKSGKGLRKVVPYRNMNGELMLNDNNEIRSIATWMMDCYNWYELVTKIRENNSYLMQVYGVGNGCLLSKRKVLEELVWAVPKNYVIGEDRIWYENVHQKGFESWVDMRTIPIHRFVGWQNVPTWNNHKNQKMYVVFGEATDEEFKETLNMDSFKKGITGAFKK